MGRILLIGEQAHGHLKKATLSALTAAQQLAAKTGGSIEAVLVGGADAAGPAQELAGYVSAVHVVQDAAFERHRHRRGGHAGESGQRARHGVRCGGQGGGGRLGLAARGRRSRGEDEVRRLPRGEEHAP